MGLKSALLKRYNLTEEGYRTKFRRVTTEQNETPLQFVVRLQCYFDKWMTLSGTDKAAPKAIQDLFLKEQSLNSCPRDLSAHLREKPLRTMDKVADAAERFLTAPNRQLYTTQQQPQQNAAKTSREEEFSVVTAGETRAIRSGDPQCFLCNRFGHRAIECKERSRRRCFKCGKIGHEARDCPNMIRAGEGYFKSNAALQGVESREPQSG